MDAIQSTIEQACAGLEVTTPLTPKLCKNKSAQPYVSLLIFDITLWQVPSLRKQAEATILEFRQSSKPIPACQHILQRSSSLPAKFQVRRDEYSLMTSLNRITQLEAECSQ